ncbi:hypothetical protein Pmani_008084 [Petrolisthes manimaculis]|uniref:Activating molecule in BECN1-regulated autophagy protein 1 n=1 Tax=Petrolisthes manimaculis TaxID=1843537 RepID=A0AAE1Q7Q9_9EUCA|nr:hypothetical protein Pmani_008084 [Petrolisthes manimaculis]
MDRFSWFAQPLPHTLASPSVRADSDARLMEEEQREREVMPRSKYGPVGLKPLPVVLGGRERYGGHTHPRTNTLQLELAIEESLVYRKHTQLSCQIPGAPKSTFLMVFSPDGSRVASTHGDHNIYVTEVKTGACICTLEGHPRTPWCVAFHPAHNNIVASGCLGGEVRVWDLKGGSEVWTTEKNTVIASLAFHPTDQVLVIATFNELYFWDWFQPKPFARITTADEREKIRYVKFDPLGHKLITGIANSPPVDRPPPLLPDRPPPHPSWWARGGGGMERERELQQRAEEAMMSTLGILPLHSHTSRVDRGTDPVNRQQSNGGSRSSYELWPPHSSARRMCRRLMAEYRERMRLQSRGSGGGSSGGSGGGGETRGTSGYEPPDYLRPYQRQLDPELREFRMHQVYNDPYLYNRYSNTDRHHSRSSSTANGPSDTNEPSDSTQSGRRREENPDQVVGRTHIMFQRFEPNMFDGGSEHNTRTTEDEDGPNHNNNNNNSNDDDDDEEEEEDSSQHPPRPPRPHAPPPRFTSSCWGYFCGDGSTGVHTHCGRGGARDTLNNDTTPDSPQDSTGGGGDDGSTGSESQHRSSDGEATGESTTSITTTTTSPITPPDADDATTPTTINNPTTTTNDTPTTTIVSTTAAVPTTEDDLATPGPSGLCSRVRRVSQNSDTEEGVTDNPSSSTPSLTFDDAQNAVRSIVKNVNEMIKEAMENRVEWWEDGPETRRKELICIALEDLWPQLVSLEKSFCPTRDDLERAGVIEPLTTLECSPLSSEDDDRPTETRWPSPPPASSHRQVTTVII